MGKSLSIAAAAVVATTAALWAEFDLWKLCSMSSCIRRKRWSSLASPSTLATGSEFYKTYRRGINLKNEGSNGCTEAVAGSAAAEEVGNWENGADRIIAYSLSRGFGSKDAAANFSIVAEVKEVEVGGGVDALTWANAEELVGAAAASPRGGDTAERRRSGRSSCWAKFADGPAWVERKAEVRDRVVRVAAWGLCCACTDAAGTEAAGTEAYSEGSALKIWMWISEDCSGSYYYGFLLLIMQVSQQQLSEKIENIS